MKVSEARSRRNCRGLVSLLADIVAPTGPVLVTLDTIDIKNVL
jgi:hypothetical protein